MRLFALFISGICTSLIPAADTVNAAEIRKIHHEPARPKPGESVLITAKLSDGATGVKLKIQAIAPGKYVRKSDPGYETGWTDFSMRDDGRDGDKEAGDGVFTVRVPESYQ